MPCASSPCRPPPSGGFDLRTPQFAWALGNRIRAAGPRGEVVALADGKTVVAIDARTGARRRLLEEGAGHAVAVSPDGRHAAADAPGGRMFVVDLQSGARHELAPVTDRCNVLAFVGDTSLLCTDREANIHVWDVPRGRHRTLGRDPSIGHGGDIEAAHERKRAIVSSGFKVLVIDVATDKVTQLGPTPGIAFKTAISRDGRKIAVGLGDGRLLLWQPDTEGNRPRSLGRRPGFVSGLLFLPDGNTLVATDETGAIQRIDLVSQAGAEIGRHGARIIDAHMSPSGRWLATSDAGGEIRLWEPGTGGLAVLQGHGVPHSVEFIGDDWLLAAGQDGWIRIQPLDPAAFVPAAPAALSRWLDGLTTARVAAKGQPVSDTRTN